MSRGAPASHSRCSPTTSPEHHGRDRDERPSYGLEAAAALGVDPAGMFKTLIANADDRLVAALVPVDRELDLKRLAESAGARKAALAEPAVAERATGYVVGGISPLGGRRRLPTFIDASALEQARGLRLGRAARSPAGPRAGDLVRLTEATVVVIARA